jgi:hypothetical protein
MRYGVGALPHVCMHGAREVWGVFVGLVALGLFVHPFGGGGGGDEIKCVEHGIGHLTYQA